VRNRPPTDDELRRQYGADVEIRRVPPSPAEIAEKSSRLELIANVFGYQKWMWKSMGGKLLAIVVLVPAVCSVYDFWSGALKTGYQYAQPYIAMMKAAAPSLSDELILFGDASESHDEQGDSVDRPLAFLVPKTQVLLAAADPGLSQFEGRLWRIVGRGYHSLHARRPPIAGTWNSPTDIPLLNAASDMLSALLAAMLHRNGPIPNTMVLQELAARGTLEFAPQHFRDLVGVGRLDTMKVTQAYGDAWLAEERTSILAVPSSFDPSRLAYLLRLSDPELEIAVVSTHSVQLFA